MNPRVAVIQQAIDRLGAHTYLEIGVAAAGTFLSVDAPVKIGVDPKRLSPKLRDAVDGHSVLNFQLPSDEFFASEGAKLLAGRKIDVAFVDGLHEWRQAVRDVENCLRYLSDSGVIVMHDCSPTSDVIATPWAEMERLRAEGRWEGGSWCGDTFKAVVWLRSMRPDLRVFVLDCDWGLGVITRGMPEHMLGFGPSQVEGLTYAQLEADRKRLLNLKPSGYIETFLEECAGVVARDSVAYSC